MLGEGLDPREGLRPVDVADPRTEKATKAKFSIEASDHRRISLLFASSRHFYTLGVDKLPGGRGHGEPVRLMIELGNEHDIVAILLYREGQKLLLASSDGRGFVVPADEALAQTRSGKVVMNPADDAQPLSHSMVADGDSVAVVGDNRIARSCSRYPKCRKWRAAAAVSSSSATC